MLEREIKYVRANIKKQLDSGENEITVSYSIRSGRGKVLIVEDRRKVVNQDDGSKSMFCCLRNVTKKFQNSAVAQLV